MMKHILAVHLFIWGQGSEKGPSACFLIISYSKRHLCPLQFLSYALEISLSIMELQGPEFLIARTFLLHVWTLMLLPGNFYNMH